MGEVAQSGGESLTLNPFQHFYRSRAFDIVFGAVPAVLLGVYSMYIAGITVYSSVHEPGAVILLVFILSLSVLGLMGCGALLVSIFARTRLSKTGRKVCGVLLSTALVIAVILVCILIMAGLSPGNGDLWLFSLAALGLFISISALKQIRLLSSGGDGAVFRR